MRFDNDNNFIAAGTYVDDPFDGSRSINIYFCGLLGLTELLRTGLMRDTFDAIDEYCTLLSP